MPPNVPENPTAAAPRDLAFLGDAGRILILGHFGSGKTEVAIAASVARATAERPARLLDLDFITPYYRCRDVAGALAAEHVEVVAPEGELGPSDLPVVTARAVHVLAAAPAPVIADVGGDEGARVIGSLAHRLGAGYDAWMVVNPYRPGTGSPEQVAEYARWLERVARVRFTGLVANPNAGALTEPAHVVEGFERVKRSADALGLPVVFTAAREDLAGSVPLPSVLPLRLRMRPPWEPRE